MTEYAKLVLAEQSCHTIEIREKATGKEVVANSCADDGSDDKIVDFETFNRDVEIAVMIISQRQ